MLRYLIFVLLIFYALFLLYCIRWIVYPYALPKGALDPFFDLSWWRRARRRWKRRRGLIWHSVSAWWQARGGDAGSVLLIVVVLGLLWVGLIITQA